VPRLRRRSSPPQRVRERWQWRERGVSDPRSWGEGSTPPCPRGSLTPRLSLSVSPSERRRTIDRDGDQPRRTGAVYAGRHRATAHVPNRVADRRSTRATGRGSRGGLANDEDGSRDDRCAVAPTSIFRERSAASRLRSLRSPLRGLDPAVALPIRRAIVGAPAECHTVRLRRCDGPRGATIRP